MYDLVASAINHPDQHRRLWGVFNQRSLDALHRQGVDVSAVVPRPHAPPVGPYSAYHGLPATDGGFRYPVAHPRFLYLLPKSLLYHLSGDMMARSLQSWYDQTEQTADVFHGCHVYPDGYGLVDLARTHSRPLTAYAHGTIINEFETFNGGTQRRIRETLRETDTVFCSGTQIAEAIHALEPTASTRVVPIGATPAHFPVERTDALRQELQVPDDATVVLFCGRFSEAKGIADLLDVLPDLDDLYFVFVGHGGDYRESIRQTLAGEETPAGTVRWKLPPVAVRRWFAVADLLVLPSYSEGRPTVIYEAMASQTPVLATTVGGIPEQVRDGTTGWLVDPGDTGALRARLQSLSREQLRQMGRRAEQRLRDQGWTWQAHAERIVDDHTSLLGHESDTRVPDATT
jgi:glycosyltransferase involved in cell wall biosynthesis